MINYHLFLHIFDNTNQGYDIAHIKTDVDVFYCNPVVKHIPLTKIQ